MPIFSKPNPLRQNISKEASEVVEHVLNELGAELHDDLIQKLSALRLHLDKLERSDYNAVDLQAAVIKMQSQFDLVIESVRMLSKQLLPVRLDNDTFENMLQSLCENLNSPGTTRVRFSCHGNSRILDHKVEYYLLRMVQELVNNAFRHSAAWNVWVDLYWRDTNVTIIVNDDGSGFSKISEFIMRLRGKFNTLRMRAEAIGAVINYDYGLNGLRATIRYPIPLA